MKWLRLQVALLAMAVSVASAQCIVTCAAQCCYASAVNQVPPCHRHHAPKQQDDSHTCQHRFFVAEGRGAIVSNAAITLELNACPLPATRVDIPRTSQMAGLGLDEASPPASPELVLTVVIRV